MSNFDDGQAHGLGERAIPVRDPSWPGRMPRKKVLQWRDSPLMAV